MTSRVLFRHNECFIYRVPPQSFSAAGHHAETWGLQKPFITGKIEVSEVNIDGEDTCVIKMFKGKSLFAMCEMDMKKAGDKGRSFYMQDVVDSSRYWVLRIEDKKSGRSAFIGFGFRERDTATELRTAVQDSLQFLARQKEAMRRQSQVDEEMKSLADQPDAPLPPSQLKLSDGETLTISMAGVTPPKATKKKKKTSDTKSESEVFASLALPPSAPKPKPKPNPTQSTKTNVDSAVTKTAESQVVDEVDDEDEWNDFSVATTENTAETAPTSTSSNNKQVASSAEAEF